MIPATGQQIGMLLRSNKFTDGEKQLIEWQFRICGDFYKALWQAIGRADESNLMKLGMGFPAEVKAYLAWTRGNLGERIRAMGVNI